MKIYLVDQPASVNHRLPRARSEQVPMMDEIPRGELSRVTLVVMLNGYPRNLEGGSGGNAVHDVQIDCPATSGWPDRDLHELSSSRHVFQ